MRLAVGPGGRRGRPWLDREAIYQIRFSQVPDVEAVHGTTSNWPIDRQTACDSSDIAYTDRVPVAAAMDVVFED